MIVIMLSWTLTADMNTKMVVSLYEISGEFDWNFYLFAFGKMYSVDMIVSSCCYLGIHLSSDVIE